MDKETHIKQKREKLDKLAKKVGFKVPIDGLMTAISGEPTIDIIKFGERLDVPEDVSMSDYLLQEFDEETRDLVDDIIDFYGKPDSDKDADADPDQCKLEL